MKAKKIIAYTVLTTTSVALVGYLYHIRQLHNFLIGGAIGYAIGWSLQQVFLKDK